MRAERRVFVALVLTAVAAVATAAAACSGRESDGDRRSKLDLALANDKDIEGIRQNVTDRERAFLDAFSRQDASMSDFFDMGLQFIDAATPPAEGPRLPAKPREYVRGYFSALAISPRQDHTQDRIEVHVQRKDYVVAAAIPKHGRPIITTWLPYRQGWKIAVLEINVPDSYIEDIRKLTESAR